MLNLFRPISCLAATAAALACTSTHAVEFGYPGWSQPAGTFLTNAAASPPPGMYGFTQLFTAQAHIVGPGAPNVNGTATPVRTASIVPGLLWSPGWIVLGARYEAVIAQPMTMADAGAPLNAVKNGAHNTVIVPAQLSWKLGESGFFVKTGLAVAVLDGSIGGTNGLARIGNPWWIYQPLLVVSYLRDGWNLTANISEEFNARNRITDYKSGNILHGEFTAARTFGAWSIGPVATYIGQVTNDESSAFYHNAVNANRYKVWSVGGLVGYNFGPVAINVWALKDVSANASGGRGPTGGPDTATITRGAKLFVNLNFRFLGV